MRGRIADAEDAVQEAFSRLMSADIDTIDDVRGWLIVVVSRISLDQLRSATARREIPAMSEISTEMGATTDPADRITLEDSVRLAMLVVLERLTPVERVVFVLHDVFAYGVAANWSRDAHPSRVTFRGRSALCEAHCYLGPAG